MVRTNIVLDDELVTEAFSYARTITTKRELIETALREFVIHRRMRDLRELKGKIEFAEGYDHRAMRAPQ